MSGPLRVELCASCLHPTFWQGQLGRLQRQLMSSELGVAAAALCHLHDHVSTMLSPTSHSCSALQLHWLEVEAAMRLQTDSLARMSDT